MKSRIATTFALLLLGFAAVSFTPPATAQSGAGWVTLFDGKNLDNFNKVGDANWRIEDGAAVADKGNGFLVSKASYGDFQLRAEFWVDDVANSGIFIRCTDPEKIGSKTAYEVNIWDARPVQEYGWHRRDRRCRQVNPMPKAGGKWNVYEITARASSFTVVLNGQKTVDNAPGRQVRQRAGSLHQKASASRTTRASPADKGLIKFRKKR